MLGCALNIKTAVKFSGRENMMCSGAVVVAEQKRTASAAFSFPTFEEMSRFAFFQRVEHKMRQM